VLATSINYWRKPTRGIRRSLDIAAVCTAGAYTLAAALKRRTNLRLFLATAASAAECYRRACVSSDDQASCLWHQGLHLMGNIASLIYIQGSC
jgi:hypothetical protein